MLIERKEDLSIHYWLKTLFTAYDFITVVDGFPSENLVIPSISSEPDTVDIEDFQMGDREGIRLRTWYIDIFAKNKTQRDEFAYTILDALKDGVPVYDYDVSIPSTDLIGHLNVLKRKMRVLRIDPELVSTMYYRATVSILAINDRL